MDQSGPGHQVHYLSEGCISHAGSPRTLVCLVNVKDLAVIEAGSMTIVVNLADEEGIEELLKKLRGEGLGNRTAVKKLRCLLNQRRKANNVEDH
jgi:hypothetical protein